MAIKRINQNYFLADTAEDLKDIPKAEMGHECFVIAEACEYKANSEGKWFNQSPAYNIDTSSFVSKDELESAINSIEIPSIEGLASEIYVDEAIAILNANPVTKMFDEDAEIMASNPGSKFGIALNQGDSRTLPEAMLEKGVGLYNFWIHKSNQSLPTKALEKNSSCRGLCCVDTVKDTGWYGWILLFDQDGDVYSQYIRNSTPKGWKHFVTN